MNEMPQTRGKRPLTTYNEDEIFKRVAIAHEEELDEAYGRLPVEIDAWPSKPKWLKSNDEINWQAGKNIVKALCWLRYKFEEDDEAEDDEADEDDTWPEKEPELFSHLKFCIRNIEFEFDGGDVDDVCSGKMETWEEENDGNGERMPLFAKLASANEDIVGACQSILEQDEYGDDTKRDLDRLINIFCDIFEIQFKL